MEIREFKEKPDEGEGLRAEKRGTFQFKTPAAG